MGFTQGWPLHQPVSLSTPTVSRWEFQPAVKASKIARFSSDSSGHSSVARWWMPIARQAMSEFRLASSSPAPYHLDRSPRILTS